KAPVAAIPGVFAIVAEHEIVALGNGYWAEIFRWVRRIVPVRLAQRLAIYEHSSLTDLHRIARHSDQPLYEVVLVAGDRRLKYHHLLALGLAPETDVIAREGQANVVAEPAHEQMVADEQRTLHGSRRNHAGLHHRAGNQEKCQSYPAPGEQLA